MFLLYHFWQYHAYFSVRYYLKKDLLFLKRQEHGPLIRVFVRRMQHQVLL